jgi:uncharacterized protein YigA (DUF484 family)
MTPMTENDIAEYLIQNPEFFERHAEILASVRLFGGHGARAASLQERQAQLLREKIKQHEQRIMEMIRYGNENVAIANRLHQWTCEVLAAHEPANLPEQVRLGLQEHFFVPQTAIRLWKVKPDYASQPFAGPVSDELKQFALTLDEPYMGVNPEPELLKWLDAPTEVRSVALVPLKTRKSMHAPAECFGMLVFASPDSQRFNAAMGVDFLERIATLCVASLSRLIALD